MSEERELGWDETVGEGEGFTVLPKGKVKFTVTQVERSRSKGSDKLPACAMAVVHLKLETQDGQVGGCRDFLILHTKMQFKLNQFFTALGFTKDSEGNVKMDWSGAAGRTGFCDILVDNYNGNENNKVEKYLEPQAIGNGQTPQTPLPRPTFTPPPVEQAPAQPQQGGWA